MLGNPFALGRDGSRTEVVAAYRRWLWAQMQAVRLELVCWCAPLACHADVISSALLWLHQQGNGKSQ